MFSWESWAYFIWSLEFLAFLFFTWKIVHYSTYQQRKSLLNIWSFEASPYPVYVEAFGCSACFISAFLYLNKYSYSSTRINYTHALSIVQSLDNLTVLVKRKLSTRQIFGWVATCKDFLVYQCSPIILALKEASSCVADELPYILNDEEYVLKYRAELSTAVFRAKASPGALLKGYDVCLPTHGQPSARSLSTIVRSAGGNVCS